MTRLFWKMKTVKMMGTVVFEASRLILDTNQPSGLTLCVANRAHSLRFVPKPITGETARVTRET
jgi:hypothetical protein